jgi:hypothetical protein
MRIFNLQKMLKYIDIIRTCNGQQGKAALNERGSLDPTTIKADFFVYLTLYHIYTRNNALSTPPFLGPQIVKKCPIWALNISFRLRNVA